MPKACYIHIPFCKSKCNYCSFVSFCDIENITRYIFSLLEEIQESYKGEKLNTLYLGGGTPSLVQPDLLKKIFDKFNLEQKAEITIEVNPDDCNYEYLLSLINIGFNRISIGAQTFNDKILNLIGRRHNSKQIINTVNDAKNAGFENISLDLIYGLPTQTINDITNDLNKFIQCNINHISTYGLKIEDGSFWGKMPPDDIPDIDSQADMYEEINKKLENSGFFRYEVSNYAKPEYESRHNLTYWNNEEYYGFGVSAHGYVDGIRYSNYCTIKEYFDYPTKHKYTKLITDKERLEEEIFLGFRKTEGINVEKINEKFVIDFQHKYEKILNKYQEYIIKTQKGYAFNMRGTMLSNEILPEFLED